MPCPQPYFRACNPACNPAFAVALPSLHPYVQPYYRHRPWQRGIGGLPRRRRLHRRPDGPRRPPQLPHRVIRQSPQPPHARPFERNPARNPTFARAQVRRRRHGARGTPKPRGAPLRRRLVLGRRRGCAANPADRRDARGDDVQPRHVVAGALPAADAPQVPPAASGVPHATCMPPLSTDSSLAHALPRCHSPPLPPSFVHRP